MEDFALLRFKPHENLKHGTRATYTYPNRWGVSVITGGYGREDAPYELAIVHPDGGLCYNTVITSDVEGYLTAFDVDCLMKQVSELEEV